MLLELANVVDAAYLIAYPGEPHDTPRPGAQTIHPDRAAHQPKQSHAQPETQMNAHHTDGDQPHTTPQPSRTHIRAQALTPAQK
jgi:hypothetical protein